MEKSKWLKIANGAIKKYEAKRFDQKYCSRGCYEAHHKLAISDEWGATGEERAKLRLLKNFVEDMELEKVLNVQEKPVPKPITSFASDVFPDGCVFVHTSSSGGFWKKGVVASGAE